MYKWWVSRCHSSVIRNRSRHVYRTYYNIGSYWILYPGLRFGFDINLIILIDSLHSHTCCLIADSFIWLWKGHDQGTQLVFERLFGEFFKHVHAEWLADSFSNTSVGYLHQLIQASFGEGKSASSHWLMTLKKIQKGRKIEECRCSLVRLYHVWVVFKQLGSCLGPYAGGPWGTLGPPQSACQGPTRGCFSMSWLSVF